MKKLPTLYSLAIITLMPLSANAEYIRQSVHKSTAKAPCQTKVDCRQSAENFRNINFEPLPPKPTNSLSQYPSKNSTWDYEKEGYVNKKLHLD